MKKEQSAIEKAQNEFKDAQIYVSKKAVTNTYKVQDGHHQACLITAKAP